VANIDRVSGSFPRSHNHGKEKLLLSFPRDTETHIKNILVKAHEEKSLSEYLDTQKNITA
jgi:hypothetical protein